MKRDFKLKRKKHSHLNSEDHNSNWAVSYGDMITLLLAFFVLFFKLKADDTRYVKYLKTDIENELSKLEKDTDTFNNIKLSSHGKKILVEFENISFFESGKTTLLPEGAKVLEQFGKTLSQLPQNLRLTIRAYTDPKPLKHNPNRREKDNIDLSSFRSLAAIRVLQSTGIESFKMRIAGFTSQQSVLQRKLSSDELNKERKIVIEIEEADKTERKLVKKANAHPGTSLFCSSTLPPVEFLVESTAAIDLHSNIKYLNNYKNIKIENNDNKRRPSAAPDMKLINNIYTVQIASVPTSEEAQKICLSLNQDCYFESVLINETKRFRVRLGKFSTKAEAEQYAENLITKKKISSYIVYLRKMNK